MSENQVSLNRLLDEAAIRNTIARFADSAMRADLEMFRTVWAEEGQFVIGTPPHGQSASGADAAVAMLRRLTAGKDFFVQFALPGAIEINGDHATTRTLCYEAARGPGETYYRNYCVAFDHLRREQDGWVFTSRSFQYLWLDTSAYAGNAFPLFSGEFATQQQRGCAAAHRQAVD